MDFSKMRWDVSYASGLAPQEYVCGDCGASGVKLWREYNTFLSHQHLRCAQCAMKDQEKTGTVGDDGRRDSGDGHMTDQVGWLIPAVPTEEGDTFWGYTSVPQAGVDWWRRLPTRRAA